jgi:NACalpha-BTF3-like transcription factor
MTNFLQEKAAETTKPKEEKKRGKPKPEAQEGMRHSSVSTALLQSVAEMGTQSNMKSSKKTLHEFSPHIIPQITPKRNISSSTNEMLHTDISIIAQRTRVSSTHAREAINSHRKS